MKFSDWSLRTSISGGKEIFASALGNPGATVSRYGQTNATEDFAETVAAYRYNPGLLLKRSPEKYQLMKEAVFDGLEYTSEQACAPEKSFSRSLGGELSQKAKRLVADPAALRTVARQAMQHCGDVILESFGARTTLAATDLSRANSCLEQALAAGMASALPEVGTLRYWELARKPALERFRGVGADPGTLKAFKEAVISETRDALSEMMISLNRKQTYAYLTQPSNKLPRAKFCAEYSEDAFLASKGIDQRLSDSGEQISFSYTHRDFLNRFAQEICLSLHEGQTVLTQPTDAALRSQVLKRIR